MSDSPQVEQIDGGITYDGLVYIGKLLEVKTLKSAKTGNPVEGIANCVFESSRGEEIVSIQRVLRTAVGAFNLAAFEKLNDRLAVGETWICTIGKQVSGGFTNFVALDCKVVE